MELWTASDSHSNLMVDYSFIDLGAIFSDQRSSEWLLCFLLRFEWFIDSNSIIFTCLNVGWRSVFADILQASCYASILRSKHYRTNSLYHCCHFWTSESYYYSVRVFLMPFGHQRHHWCSSNSNPRFHFLMPFPIKEHPLQESSKSITPAS